MKVLILKGLRRKTLVLELKKLKTTTMEKAI
jgi:hypothetical protein